MLVAFPTCDKDCSLARDLLRWCEELESPVGYPKHDALIVAGERLERYQIEELVELAKKARFKSVSAIHQREDDDKGWPIAPNRMFQITAQHVQQTLRTAFFWCEPDCVPTKQGWLDAFEEEYLRVGKPFMGFAWDRPNRHLTGCAVYPPNISRFNPHMLNGANKPFDIIRPELTLRHAHITDLIQHEWGDIKTNTPWTFPDVASLSRISPAACLFHRCKDGSLIDRLRERKNDATIHPELLSGDFTLFGKLRNNVLGLLAGPSTYYHSGNIGDIIYALASIRLHGGGKLLVGPVQYKTMPCRVPTTREQFDALEPLLACQNYVIESQYREKYPAGENIHDLNRFRNSWNSLDIRQKIGNAETLARMHAYTAGVLHLFDDKDCWLSVPGIIQTNRIIVHRSSRYLSADFPWKRLVAEYHADMLFVGLEDEYRDFCKRFGRVSFYRVQNILELAQVIAGGRAYIANQSAGMAIAIGCGQSVLQECWSPSPDCVFDRENFCTQAGDVNGWEERYLQ